MSDARPPTPRPPTPRPAGGADRRGALLREIARHGVTHGTAENPIVSRDGRLGTRWVMSFLGVGLRDPWLSDACDLLLERLGDFEGRQLATMGLAGSSLLAGCVLRSGGACNGLIVRETAKAHGSGKQIEGLPDPAEPVVILDDAIGTGHSALTCARILEAQGFEVEGVLCVVRFTYDSGFGLLEEHGYRVAALYDLHDDLVPVMEPETLLDPTPWRPKDIVWGQDAAPDGLAPFALARRYLRAAIAEGAMPRPPPSLAMPLPCEGGVWVSLRRLDTGRQVARMGLWLFPGDARPAPPEALAEACWMLAKRMPQGKDGLAWLEGCGLAITLFGPLETCAPGRIDNARFGIVARSRERPGIVGAALPAMPGIQGDGHQLRHAVHVNGRIRALEPFTLYRHTVDKLIEPGAPWPPGGVSRRAPLLPEDRDGAARRLIARARAVLEGGLPEGDGAFLFDAEYLFVSLHAASRQVACVGRHCRSIPEFDALVQAAAADPRTTGHPRPALTLRLSVLEQGWSRRGTPPAFCAGADALAVTVQGREVVLLPEVALDENLDEAAFQALLLAKAGAVPDEAHMWTALRTTCWDEGQDAPAIAGFRVARAALSPDRQAAALGWARWLADGILSDTLPEALLLDGTGQGVARTALRDAAIWRVAQGAGTLGVDLHAVPRTPVHGLLHHAARGIAPPEALVHAALTAAPLPDARTEPEGFWLSLRALAPAPEAALAPLLQRARRRLAAPALPSERLVRLAALCALAQQGYADLRPVIEREARWVQAGVSADGLFITAQRDIEETGITAQAAEALALAAPLVDAALLDTAGRCLDALVALSVRVEGGAGMGEGGGGGAVVRSSAVQSGAHTAHTVAALGACAAWRAGA